MGHLSPENVIAFIDQGQALTEPAVREHLDSCDECRELVAHTVLSDANPGVLPIGHHLGRYQLEALLGSGAMGTVYLARDKELDRRVALKLLNAAGRVMLEARALARLSHPHVVAVYDVGSCEGRAFISMEHVDGETLAERMGRGLPPRTAVELLVQAGEGLAAAHEAGVIHGDFKPHNALIDRSDRVRVADFGLAQIRGNVAGGSSTGAGTPRYMAPELFAGATAGPLSDQFSFCVAFYEALSGRPPFAGETLEALTAAMNSPIRPPALEGVPALVSAAILRGLDPEPVRRHKDMRALLDAVRHAQLPSPRSGRRKLVAAGGLALLSVMAIAALFMSRRRVSPPAVALAGFRNLTGDPAEDWVETALLEVTNAELHGGGELRVTPHREMERARLDLGLPAGDDAASLTKLKAYFGVNQLISGSYRRTAGSSDTYVLEMNDALSGASLLSLPFSATPAGIEQVSTRAAHVVRSALHVRELPLSDGSDIAAGYPSLPEASRLYAQGVAKLDTEDFWGAQQLLSRADALEPHQPIILSALSYALQELGYKARSRESAKDALEHAGRLSREQRLAIEAQYQAAALHWDAAIQAYAALRALAPDDADYGIYLVRAQTAAFRLDDAEASLAELKRQPRRTSGRLLVSLLEYDLADARNQRAKATQIASFMVSEAHRRGAQDMEGEGRRHQCNEELAEGDLHQALDHCQESLRLCEAVHDLRCVGWALLTEAGIFHFQMRSAESVQALVRADQIFRELDNPRSRVSVLANLGEVYLLAGRVEEAESVSRQSLALIAQVGGYAHMEQDALLHLGSALALQGRSSEASAVLEQGLERARQSGDRWFEGLARRELARMLLFKGDLPRAVGELEAARPLVSGDKFSLHDVEAALGSALLEQGDVTAARTHFSAALDSATTPSPFDRAGGLEQARMALADGDQAGALRWANESLTLWQDQGRPAFEARARALIAWIELRRGRRARAREQLRSVSSLLRGCKDLDARSVTVLLAARTWMALGEGQRARDLLQPLVQDLVLAGWGPRRLEAERLLCASSGPGAPKGRCARSAAEWSRRGWLTWVGDPRGA